MVGKWDMQDLKALERLGDHKANFSPEVETGVWERHLLTLRAVSVEFWEPGCTEKRLGSEWEARKQRPCVQTSFLECVGLRRKELNGD